MKEHTGGCPLDGSGAKARVLEGGWECGGAMAGLPVGEGTWMDGCCVIRAFKLLLTEFEIAYRWF